MEKKKKLNGKFGTPQYTAQEINRDIPFDEEKLDIFSLGAIVSNLRTCKFGFINTKDNKY